MLRTGLFCFPPYPNGDRSIALTLYLGRKSRAGRSFGEEDLPVPPTTRIRDGSTRWVWYLYDGFLSPTVSQHRLRLHLLATSAKGEVNLLVEDRPSGKLLRKVYPQQVVRAAYLDIGLVGPPTQCDKLDGTCDRMSMDISWYPEVPPSAAASHRFVLDVGVLYWIAHRETI